MTVREMLNEQFALEKASEEARREAYAAASKLKETISSVDEYEDCESLIDALDNVTKAIEKLVQVRRDISDSLAVEYERVD